VQHLTGGTVILRNKDFIILYRGKDFLPGGVAQTVIQREAQVHDEQVKEEEARLKAVDSLQMVGGLSSEHSGSIRTSKLTMCMEILKTPTLSLN
jgi:hypothetical protein